MRGIRIGKDAGGRSRRLARRAAAVVEMAVVTPLLLVMLFGIIEFGYVFMAQETLTHAVREACRTGVLPGATEAEIRERFEDVVTPTRVRVTSDDLTITREQDEEDEKKRIVRVVVSVPYERASLLGPLLVRSWLFDPQGLRLSANCSMREEG